MKRKEMRKMRFYKINVNYIFCIRTLYILLSPLQLRIKKQKEQIKKHKQNKNLIKGLRYQLNNKFLNYDNLSILN